jgi:hypothetical protein
MIPLVLNLPSDIGSRHLPKLSRHLSRRHEARVRLEPTFTESFLIKSTPIIFDVVEDEEQTEGDEQDDIVWLCSHDCHSGTIGTASESICPKANARSSRTSSIIRSARETPTGTLKYRTTSSVYAPSRVNRWPAGHAYTILGTSMPFALQGLYRPQGQPERGPTPVCIPPQQEKSGPAAVIKMQGFPINSVAGSILDAMLEVLWEA